MQNIIIKLATAGLLALALEGCAGSPEPQVATASALPSEQGHRQVLEAQGTAPSAKLQCVPYAREHSDVKIFGDASTWWAKADGKYDRESTPERGAVLVLNNYAGSDRGHVAVVRGVINAREIRVDHANWLNDGAIYLNDPVVDVSPDNDWSAVRVYNIRDGGWGIKSYPVQGFIVGKPASKPAEQPAGKDADDARIARIGTLNAQDLRPDGE